MGTLKQCVSSIRETKRGKNAFFDIALHPIRATRRICRETALNMIKSKVTVWGEKSRGQEMTQAAVERMAKKANVRMPETVRILCQENEIGVFQFPFAGNYIVIPTELENRYCDGTFSKSEVEAIMAHEMAHLKRNEGIKTFFLLVPLIIFTKIASALVTFCTSVYGSNFAIAAGKKAENGAMSLIWLGTTVLQRYREYNCDRFAASQTSPEAMSSALTKLQEMADTAIIIPSGSIEHMAFLLFPSLATSGDHPPLEKRLERLVKGIRKKPEAIEVKA
ncbi:hypothetical protein FJZ26_02535 [Candidatus Parvarchaeota archaeon]|nr:hypothetical protein [Candidatus Parvarchaeota archaeon]